MAKRRRRPKQTTTTTGTPRPLTPSTPVRYNLQWFLEATLATQSGPSDNVAMALHLMRVIEALRSRAAEDRIGFHVDSDAIGNIIVTKGQPKPGGFYPAVVAHYDTVHDIVDAAAWRPHALRGADGGLVYTAPTGIGGDDKVGVALALNLLAHCDVLKVVFFVGEESGCIGSSYIDLEVFEDAGYVLQADRRGSSDFITTFGGARISSERFLKRAAPVYTALGYEAESGSITDVMQLSQDGVGISVANMSCGYHSPHTAKEYVVWEQVRVAYRLMRHLVQQLGHKRYPFEGAPSYGGWRPAIVASGQAVDAFGELYTAPEIGHGLAFDRSLSVAPVEDITAPDDTSGCRVYCVENIGDWGPLEVRVEEGGSYDGPNTPFDIVEVRPWGQPFEADISPQETMAIYEEVFRYRASTPVEGRRAEED